MKRVVLVLLLSCFLFPFFANAANADFLRLAGFRWSFVEDTEKVYFGYTTRFSRKLKPSERTLVYRSHLLLLAVDADGDPLGHLIIAAKYGMELAGKSNLLYQYTETELPRETRRLIVLGVTDLVTSAYESDGNLSQIEYSWAKMKMGHINGVVSASSNWKPGKQYGHMGAVPSLFLPYYDENDELQTENLMKMESYLEELDTTWDKLFVKAPSMEKVNETEENVDSQYDEDDRYQIEKPKKQEKQKVKSKPNKTKASSTHSPRSKKTKTTRGFKLKPSNDL